MHATKPKLTTLELVSLDIGNFRAHERFTLEPHGNSLSITGRNGLGKSTLADAYFWLIFNTDSAGKSKFDFKPFDPATKEVIHNLEHSVKATFRLDGKEVTLRRVFKEDWETMRGRTTPEFTGHSSTYYINDVPQGETEYNRWLTGICDPKLWRVMSDTSYFNNSLKWEDRRAMLLDLSGDVTFADIIASDERLAALPGILGDHTVESYRKILEAKRKSLAEELRAVPIRISEVQNSMPEEAEPVDLAELEAELTTLGNLRADVLSGGAIAEKTRELNEVNAAILDAQNKASQAQMDGSAEVRRQYGAAVSAVAACEAEIRSLQGVESSETDRLNSQRQTLLDEFARIDGEVFSWTGVDTCGSCGQALPTDKVEVARAKAEASFNEAKAKRLEENRAQGIAIRKKLDEFATKVQESEALLAAKREELPALIAERDRLKGVLEAATAGLQPADTSDLDAKKADIEAVLATLKESTKATTDDLDRKIQAIRTQIQEANLQNARAQQRRALEARIVELRAMHKKLAAEDEKNAAETTLLDDFVRAKVSLLEGRINSRFSMVEFRLFRTQVNGGIVECCDCTLNGVPYSTGMSTGERVNAGLDIIHAFQTHYGFTCPVFVDNAESVSEPLPTPGHQLRLVHNRDVKALKVELLAA